MGKRTYTLEQIINKLREVEVFISQELSWPISYDNGGLWGYRDVPGRLASNCSAIWDNSFTSKKVVR